MAMSDVIFIISFILAGITLYAVVVSYVLYRCYAFLMDMKPPVTNEERDEV